MGWATSGKYKSYMQSGALEDQSRNWYTLLGFFKLPYKLNSLCQSLFPLPLHTRHIFYDSIPPPSSLFTDWYSRKAFINWGATFGRERLSHETELLNPQPNCQLAGGVKVSNANFTKGYLCVCVLTATVCIYPHLIPGKCS